MRLSAYNLKDICCGIVRYTLAAVMMSFGVMKMMGMQFHAVLPFSAWGQSLEQLSGRQLTWAFMGYSPWFQLLLGLFEFVPACLLLFRRSALAGAIMMLPMTLGVCLINYALHLWGNTQSLSLVLLLLNILLFVFEWEKVRQLVRITTGGPAHKHRVAEIMIALILICGVVVKKTLADYGKGEQNTLTGDWYHHEVAEYELIAERVNDEPVQHRMVRAYFGPWGMYSELNDSVNNRDGYVKYTVNEHERQLHIMPVPYKDGHTPDIYYYSLAGDFHYQVSGDTLLLSRQENGLTTRYWILKKRMINRERF